MNNTIFYLASCDTCKRILNETGAAARDFIMQDIKTDPLTEQQLDELRKIAGSYEALFSKRAQLYKSLGLEGRDLGEEDYKCYLLQHYTFLKRPVFFWNNKVFAGSDKAVLAALKVALA